MLEPGANLQHNLFFRHAPHQIRILHRSDPMADTGNAEMIEHVANAFRPAKFTGMGREPVARLTRHREGMGKIGRHALPLIASKTETCDERMGMGNHGFGCARDRLAPQMAHSDDDHPALHAGLISRLLHACGNAFNIGRKGQSGGGRMIGRNENLAIDHALARRPRVVSVGERGIVFRFAKDGGSAVIGTQKGGEVAPRIASIGGKKAFDIDAATQGETSHQLRRSGPFDMAMQLGCQTHANPRIGMLDGLRSQLSADQIAAPSTT